ncbi:MAG: glutamate 5-kinase, partial [Gloeomargarita sp. GMQP_bins_25]
MNQTVVVKIGTSSLTQGGNGTLNLATLASLVETLARLRREGQRVVLVSSGAVGIGCQRLGLTERPQNLA